MNWGKGIALALFAFATMMAWFMVKASQHPEPLVTEDYYAAELRYQEHMEGTARAHAYSAPVVMDVQRTRVGLRFPTELAGQRISGRIALQRPNAPAADRAMEFSSDSLSVSLEEVPLLPGRYNATLIWHVGGAEHITEEKVFVP